MSDLARAEQVRVTLTRPDGTTMNYVGPAAELTVLVQQLERSKSPWLVLFSQLQRLKGLGPFVAASGVAVFLLWALLWVNRAPEYRPQSHGGHYESVG